MSGELVLIVEDEDKIAGVLADYLMASGLKPHRVSRGEGVAAWVKTNRPAAILLDVMLPGRDGFDICREVRANSTIPIMMITARTDEEDRLAGFDLGADDYVCKPFSGREVAARTQALLRRTKPAASPPSAKVQVVLNPDTYRAGANGREVSLTAVEFDMLKVLISNPGRIFSRDEIMDRIYTDFRVVNDRTIDSHVKKLRRKLSELGLASQPVRSVYGVGYKYEE